MERLFTCLQKLAHLADRLAGCHYTPASSTTRTRRPTRGGSSVSRAIHISRVPTSNLSAGSSLEKRFGTILGPTRVITGNEGTVSLEFSAGATLADVAQAVNSTTDGSGVTASVDGNELTFTSTDVGSAADVSVEAAAGTFDAGSGHATGADVVARVDGVEVTGEGNEIEIGTGTLTADIEFAQGFSGQVDPITISGGAMTFNFSPDLGKPTMLALPNISAAALGGSAGRLSDLSTGGSASLSSGNLSGAIDILDTARNQVLGSRARAGAFEKYTIESTQAVLDGMEENISSAMSNIFDTDVAAETSRLVQAQILTDAATSTLMIVGRQRGMVGALLGF